VNRLSYVSILTMALSPFAAHAVGGTYEINQDCVAAGCFAGSGTGFPVTISNSGSYVLTSDIHVTTSDAIGILINAATVDLDLNGHTIDGGGTCTGLPVASCTAGSGQVGISANAGGAPVGTLHIHNGTIRGFSSNPTNSAAMFLSDVGDGTLLERLNIAENGGNGAIQLYTSGVGGIVRLRDSQIARNLIGIYNAGGPAATGIKMSVENCDISGNQFYGVVGFDGSKGSTFSNNRFNSNGNTAILAISGATIALGGNTF